MTPTLLYRIGTYAATRPWRVLVAWMVALAVLGGLVSVAGGTLRDEMTAPGTSSGRAMEILRADFPGATGAGAHLVARWPGAVDPGAVTESRRSVAVLDGVRGVTERVSDDGTSALISVTFSDELADLDLAATTEALTLAGSPLEDSGATVAVGGQVPEAIQGPNGVAELAGVSVALVVLLVAFGSLLAAGLPLIIAMLGLGAGMCLIMLLAAVADVSTVSPTLGLMMGLGVGIDYAMFMVARHREGLIAGVPAVESAARATATAGRSVVIAGTVVLVAIGGLFFAGVPGFATMGLAAGLVVVAFGVAAITAVPALLGLLDVRALPRRARVNAGAREDGRDESRAAFHSPFATRVVTAVVRRPVVWLVASVAVLLALASPALGMRLGQNDPGAEQAGTPTRIAFDLVADGFGSGLNGPLAVVAPHGLTSEAAAVAAADPGVAEISPPVPSPDGGTTVTQLVPTTGPSDEATFDLVERLHDRLPEGVELAGATAAMVDTTRVLGDHLWQVVAAVLIATYLLLVPLMRSVVVPAKAVLANALSVAAAYGVITLVFQTDAGATLVGLPQPVPVPGWAPIVLFGILFGLSMDYEVFIVSRVREHYERSRDPLGSVINGLGSTAKLVTFAGAIIIAVALGFAFDPGVMVKIIGVGIAAAILVDITVVRLVLVPAALALLGHANWYVPAFFTGRQRGKLDAIA
jgi:RND superfamily putative drug exporter